MNYANQYGEMDTISKADEVWLNDEFFARKMGKAVAEREHS